MFAMLDDSHATIVKISSKKTISRHVFQRRHSLQIKSPPKRLSGMSNNVKETGRSLSLEMMYSVDP